MMRYAPVPIDERAAKAARQRMMADTSVGDVDTSLWAGVLFWLAFATLAVVAGL